MLPALVLDVEVRGQDEVIGELAGLVTAPGGWVRVLAELGGCGKVDGRTGGRGPGPDGWWPGVVAVGLVAGVTWSRRLAYHAR